jgi:hypothetical protein
MGRRVPAFGDQQLLPSPPVVALNLGGHLIRREAGASLVSDAPAVNPCPGVGPRGLRLLRRGSGVRMARACHGAATCRRRHLSASTRAVVPLTCSRVETWVAVPP